MSGQNKHREEGSAFRGFTGGTGSVDKGAIFSRLLMGTLRSINALLLGTSCCMVFGYVHTADNPADAPSRWGES